MLELLAQPDGLVVDIARIARLVPRPGLSARAGLRRVRRWPDRTNEPQPTVSSLASDRTGDTPDAFHQRRPHRAAMPPPRLVRADRPTAWKNARRLAWPAIFKDGLPGQACLGFRRSAPRLGAAL